MAYKRKTWKNDSSTPLNADGLNDFDNRVGDAVDDALPVTGKNTNGTWTKYPDGTMIARHSLNLNYADSAYVQSRWNFPQTFIENPHITGGIRFGSASKNAAYLGGFGFWSKGGDHCFPRIYSTNLGFQSGDVVEVDVIAIGRWK